MKPMKPCKAWALTGTDGRISFWKNLGADIYLTKASAKMQHDPETERLLRVRILEDAAVERAIACIRESLPYVQLDDRDRYCAAIRDLGGKL